MLAIVVASVGGFLSILYTYIVGYMKAESPAIKQENLMMAILMIVVAIYFALIEYFGSVSRKQNRDKRRYKDTPSKALQRERALQLARAERDAETSSAFEAAFDFSMEMGKYYVAGKVIQEAVKLDTPEAYYIAKEILKEDDESNNPEVPVKNTNYEWDRSYESIKREPPLTIKTYSPLNPWVRFALRYLPAMIFVLVNGILEQNGIVFLIAEGVDLLTLTYVYIQVATVMGIPFFFLKYLWI